MFYFFHFLHSRTAGQLFSFLLIGFFLNPLSVWALPQVGQVENGTVDIQSPAPNVLNITASDQAIINWESFNLSSGDVVNFYQPSVDSMALNRVFGGGASDIAGLLNANGGLILVNAAGINFLPTAQLQVGSLIASSLNIQSNDFLAGRYRFARAGDDPVGMVVNEGKILAVSDGFLLLLGGAVANTGTMTAQLGDIAMASGDQAIVTIADNQLLSVVVDEATKTKILQADGTQLQDAVKNSGTILAPGGTVRLTAQTISDVFDNAINQEGIVSATSVVEKNGKIILAGGDQGISRVSGALDVSGKNAGETGGEVLVLGNKVGLFDDATIDASGDSGGGTVLIGGDYRGENLDVQNANATYMSQDASINASAIENGNGGKVIVWGDESTKAYGMISVNGGSISGDGGLIETSGHFLDVAGIDISAAALNGMDGRWLLDPRDVTISSSATSGGSIASNIFTPTADDSILNVSTLVTALGSANINVTTGSTGSQPGNITIASALTYGGTNTLTLTAAGAVAINAATSLGGNFVISAGGAVTQSQALTVSGTTTITATGYDVTLNHASNNFGNQNMTVTADDITIRDNHGTGFRFGVVNSTGDINVTATKYVLVNTGSSAVLTSKPAGQINLTSTADNVYIDGYVKGDGSNSIHVSLTGGIVYGYGPTSWPIQTNGGSVTFTAQTGVRLASWNIAAHDFGTVSGTTAAGEIWLGATGALTVGNLSTSSGEIYVSTNGAMTTGSFNSSAALTLTGSALTIGGTATAGGAMSFSGDEIDFSGGAGSVSGTGALTLQPYTNSSTIGIGGGSGTLDLNDTDLLALANGFSGITIGHSSGTGDIDISSSTFRDPLTIRSPSGDGDITLSGSVTGNAMGSLTLQAGDSIESSGGADISSSSGALDIIMNSDRDANNDGHIRLTAGTVLNSNGGEVILSGRGGTTADLRSTGYAYGISGGSSNNSGVFLVDSEIYSGAGNITLRGHGDTLDSFDNHGVNIYHNSIIESSSGNITLVGVNGNGSAQNNQKGISIYDAVRISTTTSGNITLTGTGDSSGTGQEIMGMIIGLNSIIRTDDTGSITITGTGGTSGSSTANYGVYLTAGSRIEGGNSGSISVTGTQGNNSSDIFTENTSTIGEGALAGTYSGAVTLTGDEIDLSGGANSVNSTGALVLQPSTTSATIGIGGGSGTLDLNDTDLAALKNGFSSITIGRSDGTGDIDISSSTFLDPVTIRSPSGDGDITMSGNVTGNAMGSLTLQAGDSITTSSSADISSSSGALDIIFNSDRDASSAGNILIGTGSVLDSNGGEIILSGGTSTSATLKSTGYAFGITGGAASTNRGVFLTGAQLLSGAGAITIRGTGASQNATQNHGFEMTLSSVVESSSGNITINGKAGNGSSTGNQQGSVVYNTARVSTTTSGNIDITGTANNSGTGSAQIGVDVHIGGIVRADGTGSITLTGTGGSGGSGTINSGIYMAFGGIVESGSTGPITLNGTGGNGSQGIYFENADTVYVGEGALAGTYSGNINFNSNTMKLDTGVVQTTGTLSLLTPTAGRLIDLGNTVDTTANTLELSGAELQQLLVGNLIIGDGNNGNITAHGISAANSNNISGNLTLNATRDNARVIFNSSASTFNTLTANADDGIDVDVNVTTDTGAMTFNGDSDNGLDTYDNIDLAAVTLTSAGAMSLTATTGGILLSGANSSTTTLDANGDALLTLGTIIDTNNPNLTVNSEGNITLAAATGLGTGTYSFTADNDNDSSSALTVNGAITGSSTLTLSGDAQVDLQNVTTSGALSVSGTNIDLNGTTYSSGADAVTFTGAVDLDAGATSTTVTSGGGSGDNMTFTSTINDADGDTALAVNAGTSGNVNFQGNVGATNALPALTITNAADVNFGGSLTTTENLTQSAGTGTTTFGASTIGGALNMSSSGISQTGALSVVGTTTLDAGAGDIVLTNAGNDFGNQALTLTGDDVSMTDNNATGLDIEQITGTGAVHVIATGVMTNGSGLSTNLTAGKDSSLSAGLYIGDVAEPFAVDISGILSITANDQLDGNSAVLTGIATSVATVGDHASKILFNGIDLNQEIEAEEPDHSEISDEISKSIEVPSSNEIGLDSTGTNFAMGFPELNADFQLQWENLGSLSAPGGQPDAIEKNEQEVDLLFQPLLQSIPNIVPQSLTLP